MSKKSKRRTPAQPRPSRRAATAPLPLVSSDQLSAALRRLGFVEGPARGSSHQSMWRPRPDGGKDVTTVVLGKKELPRGTTKGILAIAGVSEADFLRALRKRRR